MKERIEKVKERNGSDGEFASESEFSEEMMDIRRDLVTIHGEMVLLKNYSSLNFAGLIYTHIYIYIIVSVHKRHYAKTCLDSRTCQDFEEV